MQRILIGSVVCFAPLLVYCLLLIGLNSRRRASMIPGPWDFAGVLLATSGFLLGGGPLILTGLNAGWRRYVLGNSAADWRSLSGEGDAAALGIWTIYFIGLIVGAAWLLWRRRNYTILYNVDTEHFPAALEWVLGRLAIVWHRCENRYDLQKPPQSASIPWRPPLVGRDLMMLPEPAIEPLGKPDVREHIELCVRQAHTLQLCADSAMHLLLNTLHAQPGKKCWRTRQGLHGITFPLRNLSI